MRPVICTHSNMCSTITSRRTSVSSERSMSGDDEFIRGKGYLYQGLWLGEDPEALKPIELRKSDVVATERHDRFIRVITRTGHTFIIYDLVRAPRSIQAVVTGGSQDSPPRRVIYLPANLPRHEDEEK